MHIPVLADKVIEYLDLQPGEHVVDCTAGGGGHTFGIAEHIAPKGKVLALDWDEQAIAELQQEIKSRKLQECVTAVARNYAELQDIVEEYKFRPVHKIVVDLGFSSDQIEKRGKGFSFQKAEPLDMRYSLQNPTTAEKIVNFQSRAELEHIVKTYGEEQFAKQIAAAIIEARAKKPITTTTQLVSIIESATPKSYQRKKIHAATKTFQALRIATNNELENVRYVLQQTEQILEPRGRIAILTFHSLEDRMVKQFFQQSAQLAPITKKPITPSTQEIKNNPRARSAKLRVAEKIQQTI